MPLADIEPGDLLFYGYDGDQHVAMYVGDGKMIEAEMTGTQVHIVPVRLGYGFFGFGPPAGLAVSGVPTSFHLGPLVFHIYGFGLAHRRLRLLPLRSSTSHEGRDTTSSHSPDSPSP